MKKITSLLLVVLLVFTFTACQNKTAAYPTRAISIVVPFNPGGGQDIAARIFAKYAEKYLGQKVVVNNMPGGSGTIGNTYIADAKPDGYTLGIISTYNSNDSLLFKGVKYNEKSFIPVTEIAADPHIIVVSKSLGVKNINELIALAKSKPGQLKLGLGGAWTSHDFLRLAIEKKAGVTFKRMVFQGGAPALNAVAGGNCDIAVPFVSEALAQIEAKNVVPIAITSSERFELVKDIPTLKESGFDLQFSMWRGFVVPAGTPDAVVNALDTAFKKAFDDPQFQKDALAAGLLTEYKGHKDFVNFYNENHEHFKAIIQEQNIQVK